MEVSSKVPSDVLLPPLLDPALEQVQLLSKSDAEGDGGPVISFISPLTAPQLFLLA